MKEKESCHGKLHNLVCEPTERRSTKFNNYMIVVLPSEKGEHFLIDFY